MHGRFDEGYPPFCFFFFSIAHYFIIITRTGARTPSCWDGALLRCFIRFFYSKRLPSYRVSPLDEVLVFFHPSTAITFYFYYYYYSLGLFSCVVVEFGTGGVGLVTTERIFAVAYTGKKT